MWQKMFLSEHLQRLRFKTGLSFIQKSARLLNIVIELKPLFSSIRKKELHTQLNDF